MTKPQKPKKRGNPVAKNMEIVNRPATHKDKTDYNKKDKSYKRDVGSFYTDDPT